MYCTSPGVESPFVTLLLRTAKFLCLSKVMLYSSLTCSSGLQYYETNFSNIGIHYHYVMKNDKTRQMGGLGWCSLKGSRGIRGGGSGGCGTPEVMGSRRWESRGGV